MENIIFSAIAGLGIFLFGINLMSNSLKKLAGAKMKMILEKTTNTPIKGILVGFLITTLIQSSSGTTALVVSLITAGLLTLPQAISIIIGANIGTTTTSILIGLDIGKYAAIFILAGAILVFFFKQKKINRSGNAILGFGLLFFGLNLMGDSLSTLTTEPFFENIMSVLSNNRFLSFFTGTFLTGIIQSSSATIGIIQKLYVVENSTLTLSIAIPFMLGANVGTTITGILASLGGSRNSKRAALFHIIFNVTGVIIFLILLNPFISLLQLFENNLIHHTSGTTIAFANVFFNASLALTLGWFIHLFEKLIVKILPYTTEEQRINTPKDKLNKKLIKSSPILAIESARFVICDMAHITLKMFKETKSLILDNNKSAIEEINSYESMLDIYDSNIHDYLTELVSSSLDNYTAHTHAICLDTIRDLERIGDHCTNLKEFIVERIDQKINFNQDSIKNVQKMLELLEFMVTNSINSFVSNDKELAKQVTIIEPEIDALEKSSRKEELNLMATGVIKDSDLHFVDILANLERIGDHANNIAENILVDSVQSKLIKEN